MAEWAKLFPWGTEFGPPETMQKLGVVVHIRNPCTPVVRWETPGSWQASEPGDVVVNKRPHFQPGRIWGLTHEVVFWPLHTSYGMHTPALKHRHAHTYTSHHTHTHRVVIRHSQRHRILRGELVMWCSKIKGQIIFHLGYYFMPVMMATVDQVNPVSLHVFVLWMGDCDS